MVKIKQQERLYAVLKFKGSRAIAIRVPNSFYWFYPFVVMIITGLIAFLLLSLIKI